MSCGGGSRSFRNPKSLMSSSGRVTCNTSNTWITDSTINFGSNAENWNQASGAGALPSIAWEHKGTLVPAGTALSQLYISGCFDSTEPDDLRVQVVIRTPTSQNLWADGIDDDADFNNTVIHDEFLIGGASAGSNADTDLRMSVFDVNHIVAEDSYLSLYFRPEGTITSSTFFIASLTWYS